MSGTPSSHTRAKRKSRNTTSPAPGGRGTSVQIQEQPEQKGGGKMNPVSRPFFATLCCNVYSQECRDIPPEDDRTLPPLGPGI
ncbi:hypothetical protein BV898_01432 [Hypsibius exemplaris]|uniref:Uncharacterized protein n=1 Tax=Hypsibius exemplaris TaxID=2072580 RepID=A0A1W0XBM2_HYPEX|nr:hypothetical protein BV898_01432 [Hypsibius exemplaris]